MGLTWRDLVSSVAAVAIILAYTFYLAGLHVLILSSPSAASVVILALGAGCAVAAAGDLHTRPQPLAGRIFRRITTVIGTIALLAGLTGAVAGSAHALEILVVATIMMWTVATFWHVLTIGAEQ